MFSYGIGHVVYVEWESFHAVLDLFIKEEELSWCPVCYNAGRSPSNKGLYYPFF